MKEIKLSNGEIVAVADIEEVLTRYVANVDYSDLLDRLQEHERDIVLIECQAYEEEFNEMFEEDYDMAKDEELLTKYTNNIIRRLTQ